jgi:hypothetical protein
MSAKALLLCAHELEKLGNGLSRPLADEVFEISADLKQRGGDLAAETKARQEAYAKSPLHNRARSGSAGSSWPRVERNLNKTF